MRRFLYPVLTVCAFVAYAVLSVAIGLGWMAGKSFAQAVSETVVDIRPFVNEFVIPLLSTVALALGSYILVRVRRWLGIQDNDRLASLADDALRNGITYAQNMAQSKVAGATWSQTDAKNKILKSAVDYVAVQIPSTLKKLGYDPATEEGRKAIERLVVARLPKMDVPPSLPGI